MDGVFYGCNFEGCNFDNAKLNESNIDLGSFVNCSFVGSEIMNSVVYESRISNCSFKYTNLSGTSLNYYMNQGNIPLLNLNFEGAVLKNFSLEISSYTEYNTRDPLVSLFTRRNLIHLTLDNPFLLVKELNLNLKNATVNEKTKIGNNLLTEKIAVKLGCVWCPALVIEEFGLISEYRNRMNRDFMNE